MGNEHSSKVVRLLRREYPATRIVALKEMSKVPELSLSLTRARFSEHKNISQITLMSRANAKREHESDSTLIFHTREKRHESGFVFASGIVPKIASLFLIPMILVYPLYPAYAADKSVASTATTTDVLPPPPVDNSTALTGGNILPTTIASTKTTDSPAAPATVGDIPSIPLSVAGSAGGQVLGDATSTTPAATSTESIPIDTLLPASVLKEESVMTYASSTLVTSSSTLLSGGAISDEVISFSATSTNNATSSKIIDGANKILAGKGASDATSSKIIDHAIEILAGKVASTTDATNTIVVIHTKTAEELAEEIVAQKEDSMRASIRKEVEGEFSKGCLTIDSIGYYCLKDPNGQSGSLTPSLAVTGVDAQLAEGSEYKQIFMTKGGVSIQVTHDQWDNAFPSIDVSGKSLVWQGNVSGRWQIFFTNLTASIAQAGAAASSTPVVTALTHSNESNFNPRVDGDDVVWQGWVDGNWEIFLAEHLTPENYLPTDMLPVENIRLGIDHTWKVTRITTNSVHDMFPAIVGGLVTWQSFQNNTWDIYAYSIKTGITTKLSQGSAKSENPRFAITWDERSPEGAARMVGYDIASGKTIDLTNVARQVNDNSAPYHPSAPISQDNQAALPVTTTGTTTTSVRDGTSGNGPVP